MPGFMKRLAGGSCHLETKLSPLSCLELLNTKAVYSSSEGLFPWLWLLKTVLDKTTQKIRFLYRLPCGHRLLLLKEIVLEN